MIFSKFKYIFCLCIIALVVFVSLDIVSSSPNFRKYYGKPFVFKGWPVASAYSLYFHNMFPVYLHSIKEYCEENRDHIFPLDDGPFHPDQAQEKLAEYENGDFSIYAGINDLGMVFIIYLASILQGCFNPPGVVTLNILVFLSALLFVFCSFHKQKMTLAGLLVCLLIASNPRFMPVLYYYCTWGWVYPLIGTLLIFAIFMPIILNQAMPENKLWFKIISAGIIFFVFMISRSSIIFISLSILLFVFIYGKVPIYKRTIRIAAVLLILIIPYFAYTSLVTYLRHYYHSKYQLPDTKDDYKSTHHLIWHSIYIGLGDFGKDKGFQWRDENALEYARTIEPGIKGRHKGYEAILRRKVLSTIYADPMWYMKILLLRTKKIFWAASGRSVLHHWQYAKYPWVRWVMRSSLIAFFVLSVLFRKHGWLKMYLFFIPGIFTGIVFTTALGIRYYFEALMLYYIPLVFVISFIVQVATNSVVKLRVKYGVQENT